MRGLLYMYACSDSCHYNAYGGVFSDNRCVSDDERIFVSGDGVAGRQYCGVFKSGFLSFDKIFGLDDFNSGDSGMLDCFRGICILAAVVDCGRVDCVFAVIDFSSDF